METKNEKQKNDLSFTLYDQRPDLVASFTELKKIAQTRQNEYIRRTMLNTIKSLWFAYAEIIQQVQLLYDEIRDLKQEIQIHKAVIQSMADSAGLNPNLHFDHLRLSALISKQLANLKQKGLL